MENKMWLSSKDAWNGTMRCNIIHGRMIRFEWKPKKPDDGNKIVRAYFMDLRGFAC